MIKIGVAAILFFSSYSSFAQAGDFVVIKKKNQTIRTFFSGSLARFQLQGGEWFNGRIVHIQNDSLFFREVIVQQVPTPWGVTRLDTMTTYVRKVHYNDIIAVPRRKESFTYIKNGSLLMIGGGGFIGLNLINSAYQRYAVFGKDNLQGILIAAGAFAAGITMHKLHKPYHTIGKKYKVKYIKT